MSRDASSSLFHQQLHPFVWTSQASRPQLRAVVDTPLWHRFLEETSRHFSKRGLLSRPAFPVFCHDGDLDEVMALAVLAYVGGERRHWDWIADWLRDFGAYFRQASPGWRERRTEIMRGNVPSGCNPRQWFEGFTKGVGYYWVEAGLMTSVLHLLDLLESEAPQALTEAEKALILEALADYAERYAFHEEALKYSNRGIWANAGILVAAMASADSVRARVLRHQSARRNRELRSTFFDDGTHAEGSSDYHLMAADGLLAYAQLAAALSGDDGVFDAGNDEGDPFGRYLSLAEIVKGGLRTVLPGPVPWNHPRGCSVSVPLPLTASLVHAYRLTRDPEIGWFIRARQDAVEMRRPSPLAVTSLALLGLGSYQPLLNFWNYVPLEETHPPRRLDVLPDHGGIFSRSGWDGQASCLTLRFGYEGTGKGHRDHAHVLVKLGADILLGDPFPRYGPPGLESSLFHNTLTLDRTEPSAVIGRLLGNVSLADADAFLVTNSAGHLPDRSHLHDPREESNYWFTNQPEEPAYRFDRAVLHLHRAGVIGIDTVALGSDSPAILDWFFHSPLRPAGYEENGVPRHESYRLRPRQVVDTWKDAAVALRGTAGEVGSGETWESTWERSAGHVTFRLLSLDMDVRIENGHHHCDAHRSADGIQFQAETDYFTRVRATARSARLVWMLDWSGITSGLSWQLRDDAIELRVRDCILRHHTTQQTIELMEG